MQGRDDDETRSIAEVAPPAQAAIDVFPELPLGIEAFHSPLHTIPAAPQVRESWPLARAAYVIGATLAVAVGLFTAFAMQDSAPVLTEAREDLVSSAPARLPAARTAGIVRSAPAAAPRPSEMAAPSEAAPTTPSVAPAPARSERTAVRRAKRSSSAGRAAAARARAKPATRAVPSLPARKAVLAAMRSVTPDARRCLSGTAVANVDITFKGATGEVSAASARGVDGAAASCVERAVRRAKLPPFAKSGLDISFPFRASR
jgi:hypothetical protein